MQASIALVEALGGGWNEANPTGLANISVPAGAQTALVGE